MSNRTNNHLIPTVKLKNLDFTFMLLLLIEEKSQNERVRLLFSAFLTNHFNIQQLSRIKTKLNYSNWACFWLLIRELVIIYNFDYNLLAKLKNVFTRNRMSTFYFFESTLSIIKYFKSESWSWWNHCVFMRTNSIVWPIIFPYSKPYSWYKERR